MMVELTNNTNTEQPLPVGWSQHLAPSGHYYYYNSVTKKSTYDRPLSTLPQKPEVKPPIEQAHKSEHSNNKRQKTKNTSNKVKSWKPDRPKYKLELDIEPWVLVFLRSGRRFVYNTETKQSLWTPPEEVQAVIDRVDTDDLLVLIAKARGLKLNEDKKKKQEPELDIQPTEESVEPELQNTPKPAQKIVIVEEGEESFEEESDEEQGLQEDEASSPGEDLAWLDDDIPSDFENLDQEDVENGAASPETKTALFHAMLDSAFTVNPYNEWDLEYAKVVEDDRYTVFDTMKDRKTAFDNWAKQKIAQMKEAEQLKPAPASSSDPTVQFLEFLQKTYKPKYYFVDFKRKHLKTPEFAKSKLSNEEKSALFRTFSLNMKKPEPERIRGLMTLLQNHGPKDLALLKDPRYYVVPEKAKLDLLAQHK